jgi:type I restriction enzyme, R subunit
VGGGREHRTPNIEHPSEEKRKTRTNPARHRLNPDLPGAAIEGAVEEICRDRPALSLAEANGEIDKLLKQGVKVSFPDREHGG